MTRTHDWWDRAFRTAALYFFLAGASAHASGVLETSLLDHGYLGDAAQTGFVGTYTELYGARPANASPESVYPYFVARAKKDLTLGAYDLHGEGEAGINMSVPSSYYIDVPEAYAERKLSSDWTATGGRKKFQWSRLDDVWEQGLWQPRFRWNYFDPEPVGMTGFFAENHGDNHTALFFATPVFIPEQDAPFTIKNGAFTTDQPFFNTPPTTVPIMGQNTNVTYQLGTYNIADIVFHPGAGALYRLGGDEGGWGKVSYAYQPVNQILLGYQGLLNIDTNTVPITLYPRVLYHHLAALEGGFDTKETKTWASVTADRPIPDTTPGSWTTQQISPAVLAATGVDTVVWGEGVLAAHLQASYLYRWGGVQSDQGPLAASSGSIFESRFTVQDATTAALEVPLTHSYRHRLTSRTRATYDFSVSGMLFSTELRYESSERWVLTLGGDMIGASYPSSQAEGGADMFFLYRNDNRVRGGLTYVF